MAGKTTSAGYRLPVASSCYHEKCISASVKAIKDVSDKTSDKTYSHGAYRDCNVVAQERIWTEYVQRELKQAKTWWVVWLLKLWQLIIQRYLSKITNCVHVMFLSTGRKTGHS